jgi:hypothetical protein
MPLEPTNKVRRGGVPHLRDPAPSERQPRLVDPGGEAEIGADVGRTGEAARVADDGIKGEGAQWSNARDLHEAAADLIVEGGAPEFIVDRPLIVDLLFAMMDQMAQGANEIVGRPPEDLPDFGFHIVPKARQILARQPAAEMLELAAEDIHRGNALADQMAPDRQARLEALAFEALQMDSRDRRCSETACFRDSDRIAGIGLVAPEAEELAELALLVKLDLVAEIAQAARKGGAGGGFEANRGESPAPQANQLPVDAFHRGRAASLVHDFARVVDHAHRRRLDADIETGPETLRHVPPPGRRPRFNTRASLQRASRGSRSRGRARRSRIWLSGAAHRARRN